MLRRRDRTPGWDLIRMGRCVLSLAKTRTDRMKLQPIFDRLPAPLRFLAMVAVDELGLMKVRTIPWDAALGRRLGRVGGLDLRRVFQNPALDAEWARVEPRLAALAITDKSYAVNPGDRRALYYLVRGLGARSVLEIGTHIGGSTVHLAAALRETRSADPAAEVCLVTDDVHDVNDPVARPWLAAGSTYSPLHMIETIGCADFVTFQVERSLAYFATCRRKFDLIFLDGSHSARVTYQEIPAAMGVLNDGGFLLLHDYYPGLRRLWPGEIAIPGPYLGVRHLLRHGAGEDVQLLPLGDLPWPTRLGANITSLALLGRP
jgi:predicted O-methyltransferase YrrM